MKTANLFDVPKDSPTRRERIEAFKKTHGIVTHDSGTSNNGRWMAVLFDRAWEHFGAIFENAGNDEVERYYAEERAESAERELAEADALIESLIAPTSKEGRARHDWLARRRAAK